MTHQKKVKETKATTKLNQDKINSYYLESAIFALKYKSGSLDRGSVHAVKSLTLKIVLPNLRNFLLIFMILDYCDFKSVKFYFLLIPR